MDRSGPLAQSLIEIAATAFEIPSCSSLANVLASLAAACVSAHVCTVIALFLACVMQRASCLWLTANHATDRAS